MSKKIKQKNGRDLTDKDKITTTNHNKYIENTFCITCNLKNLRY